MMTSESTVQERGQITLPKAIRARANVKRGDRFSFEVNETGQIVMTPQRRLSIHDLRRMFPITEPIGDFEETVRQAEQDLAEGFR